MLVSLPLGGYLLLLLAFVRHGHDLRSATLHAATSWGVLVAVMTETLSVPGWLTRSGLGMTWLIVDLAAFVYVARPTPAAVFGVGVVARLRDARGRIGLTDLGLLAGTGTLVALVGAVAILSPPNSWDAMQYHLPRVVHWIENQRVAFYPTHELKQLHMAPGAEFLLLQVHALWGGDRLDNLVQWSAFLGSIVGVTAIARSLGAGRRGQVLAAVLCATIPEGILGASGAKNDYVLSFWMVSLAYYALRFRERGGWLNAAGMGGALGLAWLTKGTAFALAVPMVLTLSLLWSWPVKKAFVKCLPLVLLLAIGLNLPHFARNYGLFGAPLGPGVEEKVFKYTNDTISVSTVLSNVLRNAALHFRGEHRATNAVTERWLSRVLQWVGADPDDPRTNFFSFEKFRLPEFQVREGFAGNPWHAALALIALLMLCFTGYRPDQRAVAMYTVALLLAFVVFCALLKWQPLHARLHLPLFVLGAAAVGTVIGNAWPAPVTGGVATLLLVLAVPIATGNVTRSLTRGGPFSVVGRERRHLYFGDRADVERSYRAAVRFLRGSGCRSIGLDLSTGVGNQYEYPFLALLKADAERQVRVIGVTNDSAVYEQGGAAFRPCAVVCVHCAKAAAKWKQYASASVSTVEFDDIEVFVMPGSGLSPRFGRVDQPPALAPVGVQRLRELLARLPELAREDSQRPESRATATTQPSAPTVRVGTHFRLGIQATNPQGRSPVSLSVGVLFPDRDTVRFVVAPGLVGDAIALSTLRGLVPLWVLQAGSELTKSSLVSFVVPPGVPAGTYYWFVVLTHGMDDDGADRLDREVAVTGVTRVQVTP